MEIDYNEYYKYLEPGFYWGREHEICDGVEKIVREWEPIQISKNFRGKLEVNVIGSEIESDLDTGFFDGGMSRGKRYKLRWYWEIGERLRKED